MHSAVRLRQCGVWLAGAVPAPYITHPPCVSLANDQWPVPRSIGTRATDLVIWSVVHKEGNFTPVGNIAAGAISRGQFKICLACVVNEGRGYDKLQRYKHDSVAYEPLFLARMVLGAILPQIVFFSLCGDYWE